MSFFRDMFGGASRESSTSSRSSSSADRGSSSGDRPSSIEINGRTVTDPAQIDRIQRNFEASARYAVDAYQREGTPIPPHLRDTVDAQIARGDYGSPSSGSQRGNLLDLFLGPAPGSTASILGTPSPGPTPGPGYYAGLGTPGVARDDTPGNLFTSPAAETPAAEAPPPEDGAPPGYVSPIIPGLLPVAASNVAFNPETQFTFEQYLQQLPGAVAPPQVAPIGLPPINQGLGSLVPPPVGINPPQMGPPVGINPPQMGPPVGINPPQMGPPVGINPPQMGPILYFGPDGQPVYGGIMG
jgi:hypothetical protein